MAYVTIIIGRDTTDIQLDMAFLQGFKRNLLAGFSVIYY
jgi:hypothetical protein